MRTFTAEEIKNIELKGLICLAENFDSNTIGYKLSSEIIRFLNNEQIVDRKVLDEIVFLCFSNGAKLPPMTAVIPRESFSYVENFKSIKKETLRKFSSDQFDFYKALVVLFLNNIIRIYPEEAIQHNLVLDRSMHYVLPSTVETINFIDLIIDLIENEKPAFVSFINYQETNIEHILTKKITYITEKEEVLSKELEESKRKIEALTKENEVAIQKNDILIKENEKAIKENRNSIITIVSLIVTIVPLFIVNLSILVNSFNIILLLCINGVLLSLIAVIFYLIERIIGNKTSIKPFITFGAIGIGLLIIGIAMWVISAVCPNFSDFIKLLVLK